MHFDTSVRGRVRIAAPVCSDLRASKEWFLPTGWVADSKTQIDLNATVDLACDAAGRCSHSSEDTAVLLCFIRPCV